MEKQEFIDYFIEKYRPMIYDDYVSSEDSLELRRHNLVFMRPRSDDTVESYGVIEDDFYSKVAFVKNNSGEYIFVDVDEHYDDAYRDGWTPPKQLALFELDDNYPYDILTDGAVKELQKFTIYDDYDDKDTVYGYGYLFDFTEIMQK